LFNKKNHKSRVVKITREPHCSLLSFMLIPLLCQNRIEWSTFIVEKIYKPWTNIAVLKSNNPLIRNNNSGNELVCFGGGEIKIKRRIEKWWEEEGWHVIEREGKRWGGVWWLAIRGRGRWVVGYDARIRSTCAGTIRY
jgi:hypothetical protein